MFFVQRVPLSLGFVHNVVLLDQVPKLKTDQRTLTNRPSDFDGWICVGHVIHGSLLRL